jgi:hypothetical protein
METCRHPFSPYPPIMTLPHKLLMAFFAIGIVCFLGTKIPLATRDGLMSGARNSQTGDPHPETAGSARHPSHPKNASTDPSVAVGSVPHQTKSNQRLQAKSDRPISVKAEDFADASQASPYRNSRKFSFPLSHPLEVPKPPASLVWIDGLTAEQDSAIQQLAEEFKQKVQAPSQPPSSSADYAQSYQEEARLNDIRFQTRYGDQLWLRHHIAAHHLDSGVAPAK